MLRRLTRDRYLTDDELRRFMAAVRERRHVHQPRDHALFALLANTGIRPSEALALTRADLNLEGAEPWIALHRTAPRHAPDPTNELVIHAEVADVLRCFASELEAGARVFTITKRQAERLFHYYAGRAGLGSAFKLYALRHTAGMRIWRATKDARVLQAILGHRQISTTMAYAHTSQADMRRAMDRAGTAA